MKFLHAVGPIAISLAVWPQLIAENERKIWHIVPSLWQTTVLGSDNGTDSKGAQKPVHPTITTRLSLYGERFIKSFGYECPWQPI